MPRYEARRRRMAPDDPVDHCGEHDDGVDEGPDLLRRGVAVRHHDEGLREHLCQTERDQPTPGLRRERAPVEKRDGDRHHRREQEVVEEDSCRRFGRPEPADRHHGDGKKYGARKRGQFAEAEGVPLRLKYQDHPGEADPCAQPGQPGHPFAGDAPGDEWHPQWRAVGQQRRIGQRNLRDREEEGVPARGPHRRAQNVKADLAGAQR